MVRMVVEETQIEEPHESSADNVAYVSYNDAEALETEDIEETEDDAMEMLTEMGILDPIIDEEGNVLTDENGNVLTI